MAYIMKHETWMELTNAGLLATRSSQLKGIDRALAAHQKTPSPATLSAVKLAMHHWKMSKGYDAKGGKPGWLTSERNRRGAVTTLEQQLFGVSMAGGSAVMRELAQLPFYGIEELAAEDAARDAMKRAREEAMQELFMGRQLVFKRGSKAVFGAGIGYSLTRIKKKATESAAAIGTDGISAGGGALGAANDLINGILADLSPDIAQETLRALNEMVPNFINELAASIAPYYGVIRSGAKTTQYLVKTIIARYRLYDIGNHLHGMLPGDPAAAAAALMTMIRRKVADNQAMTEIYATDTVIKGGALAIDAASLGIPVGSAVVGPVSGLMTTLAVLGMKVRFLARDVKEKKAANELLQMASYRRLTAQLFQDCPLLGCWFIACSNTSDVANFLISDIGARGWKLDVEVMVTRHVQPIIEASRDMIADSRFEVTGMQLSKGAMASTVGVMGIKDKVKQKMLAGVARVLPFVDNPQDYKGIAAKQGHTAVSRSELKGRIVGFGSG